MIYFRRSHMFDFIIHLLHWASIHEVHARHSKSPTLTAWTQERHEFSTLRISECSPTNWFDIGGRLFTSLSFSRSGTFRLLTTSSFLFFFLLTEGSFFFGFAISIVILFEQFPSDQACKWRRVLGSAIAVSSWLNNLIASTATSGEFERIGR